MRIAQCLSQAIAVLIVWTSQSLVGMENVRAGSSTDGLSVSSSVAANCVIMGGLSNLTLDFGIYNFADNSSTPLEVNGSLQLRCIRGTPAQIGLGSGLYGGNAVGSTRAMYNGAGEYLSYELYTTAAKTTVWTNSATVPYTASNSGPAAFTIYASVLANQNVTYGTYTDSVQVTVSF